MTNQTHINNKNNSETVSPVIKIAIIGGGLSGLFTATLLERQFRQHKEAASPLQITIFEKSAGVGRLATRYRTHNDSQKTWQWSFGAQFFTTKSDSFSQFITPWLYTGLLQPWCAKVINLTAAQDEGLAPKVTVKEQWDTHHARYISTPKMTSWGRSLADKLQHTTIRFKTHVAPLAQYSQLPIDQPTELFDADAHSLGVFDWVICTAPNAQAVELMAGSDFAAQDKIMQPKMQACYTLMLGWDSSDKLPKTLTQAEPSWDVAYVEDSILDRIFIEHQKPKHDALLPSVTIHARNAWSEQHVDEAIETIEARLLSAAKQALNWHDDTAPSQIDCHRWRYAATVMDDKEQLGILIDKSQQWIVSGDWCGQGNIESSYQMAEKVVEVIAEAVLE